MRLSPFQVQAICESALSHFGHHAHVWLFGSRVRDDEKGGDIDLYIEVKEQSDLVNCKLKFLRDLHKKLGNQKIDVVLHRTDSPVSLPIYNIAKETGIQLS